MQYYSISDCSLFLVNFIEFLLLLLFVHFDAQNVAEAKQITQNDIDGKCEMENRRVNDESNETQNGKIISFSKQSVFFSFFLFFFSPFYQWQ